MRFHGDLTLTQSFRWQSSLLIEIVVLGIKIGDNETLTAIAKANIKYSVATDGQKNCIINTKSDTKNVTINGPTKLRTTSMSSFLIKFYPVLACKPT